MNLLLIEDDQGLAAGLKASLAQSGHVVNHYSHGTDALAASQAVTYDIVILDIGLPDMNGIEVLRRMRALGIHIPVLILTAHDGLNDRVSGLNAGADDYLGKPFELAELEARIRALSRRNSSNKDEVIKFGTADFDCANRQLSIRGDTLNLTAREIAVVETLMHRPGRIVSKERIFSSIYDIDSDANTAAIEVYVSRVRKKLEAADAGISIRVVRGLGYRLELVPRP